MQQFLLTERGDATNNWCECILIAWLSADRTAICSVETIRVFPPPLTLLNDATVRGTAVGQRTD